MGSFAVNERNMRREKKEPCCSGLNYIRPKEIRQDLNC